MAMSGCSACLVEAIQHKNKREFRRLLANRQLSFKDTFFIPNFSKTIIDPYGISWSLPKVSIGGGSILTNLCSHVIVPENLQAGNGGTAVSVIQMAMIFSTRKFNMLQLLIESGRFDFSESIIYHNRYCNSYCLRIEAPIMAAVKVDIAHYSVSKATDFQNTKALFAAGYWSPSAVICSMSVYEHRWSGWRSSGVLPLLEACAEEYEYYKSKLALLNTLCDIGFENQSDEHLVTYLRQQEIFRTSGRPFAPVTSQSRRLKRIDALMKIFCLDEGIPFDCEENYEYYYSTFLRHGLLLPHRNDTILFLFVRFLHSDEESERSAAMRIVYQLLAIGVFCIPTTYSNPELEWPRTDLNGDDGIDCTICAEGHKLHESLMCPRVAPLLREFFSGPLTLLQMSRIEIRLLVGMRQFERRVQQLPLPRILLHYVWRANEMLLHSNTSEDSST